MRIVCWQMILMKNHTLFFRKLGKMSQNLSSAAVMIGALRVKNFLAESFPKLPGKSPKYCCMFVTFSSALDTRSNYKVAIKKLARPFQSAIHAKRTYRELRMLKHMQHENVSHSPLYGPANDILVHVQYIL